MVYYSDAFAATRMPQYESLYHELICQKINLPGRMIFIFCVYRPPSADDSIYDVISDHIDTIQELHPRSEIIVLGDLNAHHEEWLGNTKTDAYGESAFDFATLNNLHQLVDDPTRIGKDGSCSKLDLFLTTSPDNHVVSVDAPLGSSDHCVVMDVANYRLPITSKPAKRKIWQYDKADWDGMRSFLSEADWSSLSKAHSADAAWNSRIIRRARIQFSHHLEQELKYANSKQWWKLVKSVTDSNKTSAVPQLKSGNGQIFNETAVKAELLNNTFAANAHLDDKGKVPPNLNLKTDETISTIRFWPKVVLKKLRNLDTSKATGPDGISATVLKNCAPELAPVLSKLFQISLNFQSGKLLML
ncbi:uncharacterized protein [Diadema antillarum]|uniref:uncharacterized protein n=1 Tax=Diadema antillarum TaxID=105358 RepID=UPI003A8B34D3